VEKIFLCCNVICHLTDLRVKADLRHQQHAIADTAGRQGQSKGQLMVLKVVVESVVC
jgi:hypothetical protein